MLLIEQMNMNALKEILIDKKLRKVIHSAKQDIEVINYALDIKIENIFDTQMAYNVLHGGDEIGYTNLVEKLFKIKLSKKYQVSDWESRPLSKNQLAYAENDVLYLPRIYTYLINFIKKRNLINKINNKNHELTENNDIYNPKFAYKRIKTKNFNQKEKTLLKKYSKWREVCAQNLNIPRNWVISDKNLIKASKGKEVGLEKNKKMYNQQLSKFSDYINSKNLSKKG
jgi:ribonuclease D